MHNGIHYVLHSILGLIGKVTILRCNDDLMLLDEVREQFMKDAHKEGVAQHTL